MAIEEPAFKVISSSGKFEIRQYAPYLIAQTWVEGDMDDAGSQGFRRIADFVHANTASKLCMQLGHAGRKGSTQVGWEAMDMPLADTHRNWPLIAPSPIPYRDGVNQVPREMNRADMDEVIAQFVRATTLTVETDFDMIEVHMAHGYLLASFLSPITNRRTDRYGGSLRNRMRFLSEPP